MKPAIPPADWLHWRCDLSVGAAREKVRVSHALKTLPAVSAAFRDGELSYSKVRALVRVANRDNEEALLNFALKTTAARVEERCRELRCGTVDSVIEANRAYASRFLTIRRHAGRGTVLITVELPIETVRRIGCDADAVVIMETAAGEPLSVGRKTRIVPTAIKRALTARDRGCAFPGCHNTRFVDAHHVQHWSAGGETSLDNLLLLCSRHHRLVHEGGYGIDKDYRDRWAFKRPDGIAVPECGYRAEDTFDEGREIGINDLQRDSAESFLSRLEKLAAAPPN